MNPSRDALEASYAFCRQLSRRAGSSFYAGFSAASRGETPRHGGPLRLHASHRRFGRRPLWRQAARRRGRGRRDADRKSTRRSRREVARGVRVQRSNQALQRRLPPSPFRLPPSALLPALADTVRRFHIPHEHLLAVIDGVEMDLTPRRYETFDELERYCERVASAVGLACIHIWGFRGPEAFEPARQAGVALQLTNILRDLKEDAAAGRVYLPLADLRRVRLFGGRPAGRRCQRCFSSA